MPEVLASTLSREHALELVRIEQDEIKRLRRTYEQARKEILARLVDTRAETFTAQQLRSVQVQVETGLREMVKKLRDDTSGQVDSLLEQSIEQTLAEIGYWERTFRGAATQRIRASAARRVLKPRALLLHQYDTSINAYGLNLISEVQGRLGVHLVRNSSWREMSLDIAGRLDTNAIQGARWRAERIARTEMVDVLSLGNMTALEEAAADLPGLMGQWDATVDKRSSYICLELNGRIRRIGEPFTTYRGRPIVRPPAIPNCRSRLVPWHQDWADLDPSVKPRGAPKPVTRKHRPGPKPKPAEKKPRRRKTNKQRLAESLRREEQEIRNRRTEFGVLFDPDGTVVLKKTSRQRSYIRFYEDELRQFRGRVFTHNHPSGSAFSIQDLSVAAEYGLAEMRVAGSRGHAYSIRPRPDRPWSKRFFDEAIEPSFQRHSKEIQRLNWKRIRTGKLSTSDANLEHYHQVWTRVAREVGMVYSRRKVPK